MASDDDVRLAVSDGVATVTLDRPEKLNALSRGMIRGIERAYAEAAEREDARCVVLRGAGEGFCSGGDVSGMSDDGGGGDEGGDGPAGHERARGLYESVERAALTIYECPLPTIAAVDGPCVGAGVGVAMANDLLLASADATFALAFRNIGLSLDYATAYFVPRAVGPYVAKELALTGEAVSGERADDLGLVNHAYPAEEFDERLASFVATIAEGPTVALRLTTETIDRSERMTIRDAVLAESRAYAIATETRDHREGVEAFLEGRDPSFEGR